jgi:hypothetical protein
VIISLKRPMRLETIASLWAHELQDTRYEREFGKMLEILLNAVAHNKLVPTEQHMRTVIQGRREQICSRIGKPNNSVFSEDELIEIADSVMASRDAFFDWLNAEKIFPRPTFWGEYNSVRGTASAQQEPAAGATSTPAAPESPRLTPLEACVKQLLGEGYDPGSETCNWATFLLKVRERMPRQKGLSERNLHRAVKRVRSLSKLP